MKNNLNKDSVADPNTKIDDTDEIRKFIKQKELQNQVLKKIIEKIQDEKIKYK